MNRRTCIGNDRRNTTFAPLLVAWELLIDKLSKIMLLCFLDETNVFD